MDLGARHQQLAIRAGADRVRQRRPETRPAGAAVELGCRRIEVLPAALAREQPRAMLVVERARERPLGGRVAQHRISLAAKLLLPLRSEEHTSELQSLMRISYAVFCLKKKHNTNTESIA